MKGSFFVILAIGLVLASLTSLALSPASLAQRVTPTPTPGRETPTATPGSGGGGKKEKKGTPAPTPSTGVVRGIVYDYSRGIPAGGVTVILDGGGWKAETISEDGGRYIFAGLGSGPAVLKLGLPPEAHSVMPDYPVHTGSSDPADTNVGFYWGEEPPLPVILSVEKERIVASPGQSFEIAVGVKNQSGGEATGGEIDLQLPDGLTALKAAVNHGKADFTDHRVWGRLEALPDGQTATLSVQAKFDKGATAEEKVAQVAFSYNEQITPQLIRINIASSETGEQSAAASAESTAIQTGSDAASTEFASKQGSDDSASAKMPADIETLIPTTGNQRSPTSAAWLSLILSIIFIVGLGFAGFRAFTKQEAGSKK